NESGRMRRGVVAAVVLASTVAGAERRVAVMPFKPLAAGRMEWIGAGLAETLTATLASVPELRVVERAQLRAVTKEIDLATDEGARRAVEHMEKATLADPSFAPAWAALAAAEADQGSVECRPVAVIVDHWQFKDCHLGWANDELARAIGYADFAAAWDAEAKRV